MKRQREGNLKTRIACALFASILAFPASAADSYTVDPRHTYPGFEISHLGFSIMRGSFNSTRGRIVFDTEQKTGSIEIVIDTDSVTTGHAKRDEHLRNEDFFNVAKYPTMSFRSTDLKFDADKLVGADGELTLLGVTRPVSLTVTRFYCGPHPIAKKPACGANATTAIRRSDFGLNAYVPSIGDEVRISIGVEAFKD
jgi:polyisoprenoid-binding protein YceI